MTGSKPSKSELTKRFIIERSAATINKKGYAGTSISDIIALTGLTKGSIYGNFSNKDEIGLAVFDYNLENLYGPMAVQVANKERAIDKLLEYPRYLRRVYKKIFDYGGCIILNTAVEADDTFPAMKKQVIKAIKAWEKRMITAMEEGKKKHEIKKEADSKKYAALIIILFEGGMMLSKSTGEKKYFFTALDQIEHLILTELKQ